MVLRKEKKKKKSEKGPKTRHMNTPLRPMACIPNKMAVFEKSASLFRHGVNI